MTPTRLRDEAATRPDIRRIAQRPGPRYAAARSMVTWITFAVAAAVIVAVPVAKAQYIPDVANTTRADIPSKEYFDNAFQESRWQFGTLAIDPWLGIRDASLVTNQDPDNPDDSETDFTVTAGAGVRGYARASPKVMVAGHALPEYVWWQDNDERSQLNGRYGLGVFGHLNRLNFELSYRRAEQQRFFSSELPLLSSVSQDIAKAAISLELSRGISLYVVGQETEVAGDDDDLAVFTQLDRTEEKVGGGVRLESRGGLWASVGVEESTTDFEGTARNLSNEGTTIGLGLGFSGDRLSGVLELAFRDIEPVDGSAFTPFDDVTGSFNLVWSPRSSLGFLLFAQRGQTYSIDPDESYIIGDRYGLTVQLGFGAGSLQLTGALGEDDYESLSGSDRVDDVEEWGATFTLPLGDLLVLGLHGRYTEYDSNLPAFDRDITSYGLNLRLGRIVERLRLGDSEGIW